jgi:hypothetical protein
MNMRDAWEEQASKEPPTGRWRRVPLYIHLRTIKPV